MNLLQEFLDNDENDEFEETPVDLETFLYDKKYMGVKPLSAIQFDIVQRGSQVYRLETLRKLYGKEQGDKVWKDTTRDLCLILGKGSGKDYCSQLICAYAIYKLLCLKDPGDYFDVNEGESIDIVNMAINAKQAKRVFFDGFVNRIKRTPWFAGRFTPKMDEIQFDKNITLYSLHSSFEAAEGLNILIAILDEIDGFDVPGTAQAIYKALSGTVSSRYSEVGKVICLSFPRSKDGFIMKHYDSNVIEKTIEHFEHTFKINEELPDGMEGNEFSITWEEETVTGYKLDNFFALKAPTFRVHPGKRITNFKREFYDDPEDALMRYCANPPESNGNAFFKNHEKLEAAFTLNNKNAWNTLTQEVDLVAEKGKNYYIHIDLSKVRDRTVVSMGHVSEWLDLNMGGLELDAVPDIVIDLIRVWEPKKNDSVDHGEVMQFVIDLCNKYNVGWVTFDQWGSANLIEYLTSIGIPAERKPLAKPEYMEFGRAVSEYRIHGPHLDIFLSELKGLVITPDGKVDHPTRNHNDISESVCGVIRNCLVKEHQDSTLKVVTLGTLAKKEREKRTAKAIENTQDMPADIQNWLNIQGI